MAFKMTGFSGFKQTEGSQGKTTKPAEGKKELSAYEKAFAAARAAGKETFMYEGKEYNTLLKGESGRVVSEASEKAGVNAYQFGDGSQAQFPKDPNTYKPRD